MKTNLTQKGEYKNFKVTIRFQFPSWDEKDGITYEQNARTKADAIRYTRWDSYRDGHTGCGGKGRVTMSAEEII